MRLLGDPRQKCLKQDVGIVFTETYRAVASERQTEELASVILFVFVV